MRNIKTILTGLTAVSLCMGALSGKVTNTAGAPILGATIQLENAGQSVTSDADGNFSIPVGSTLINNRLGMASPHNISVTIVSGLLRLTISERSTILITAYDLSGKVLTNMQHTLEAGSNSIALPYTGAGAYLYRVRTGGNDIMLKGCPISWVSRGTNVAVDLSTIKNRLAKPAKSAAAFNDVLVVTKNEYLNYRVGVTNSDTSGLVIKMIPSSGTITDTDGNEYQTVKIGTQEWMTENLRVTKYNDGSAIIQDTSSLNWAKDSITPKYCFYNNTTNTDSIKRYGALYTWYVISPENPKKIAPTGWHVPSDSEWTILENYLVLNGYNWDGTVQGNKIAKSLASKIGWYTKSATGTIGCDLATNNSSGFSALPCGCRSFLGDFQRSNDLALWWSTTEYVTGRFAWARDLTNYAAGFDGLERSINTKSNGLSIRLVRD